MDDEEIMELTKKEIAGNTGLGRASVYYHHYHRKEHSTVGYLFDNKYGNAVLIIKGKFALENMILRNSKPGEESKVNHIVGLKE